MVKISTIDSPCDITLLYKPVNLGQQYQEDSIVISISAKCKVDEEEMVVYVYFDNMLLLSILNTNKRFTNHNPNRFFKKSTNKVSLRPDMDNVQLIDMYPSTMMSFKLFKKSNLEYYLIGKLYFLSYEFDCFAEIHQE